MEPLNGAGSSSQACSSPNSSTAINIECNHGRLENIYISQFYTILTALNQFKIATNTFKIIIAYNIYNSLEN